MKHARRPLGRAFPSLVSVGHCMAWRQHPPTTGLKRDISVSNLQSVGLTRWILRALSEWRTQDVASRNIKLTSKGQHSKTEKPVLTEHPKADTNFPYRSSHFVTDARMLMTSIEMQGKTASSPPLSPGRQPGWPVAIKGGEDHLVTWCSEYPAWWSGNVTPQTKALTLKMITKQPRTSFSQHFWTMLQFNKVFLGLAFELIGF